MTKAEVHPGIDAYVGYFVTVQFRGRIAIFKCESSVPATEMKLVPVQEVDAAGHAVVAATDCLERIKLVQVTPAFCYFEMKAPDSSVAELCVAVDLIAAIWRPLKAPSKILSPLVQ